MNQRVFILVLILTWTAGCGGGGSSPTSPSTPALNLTGTFSGSASDSSGPGQLTWRLTQTGTSVAGSVSLVALPSGITGTGSVAGTLTGTTLTFTMTIPRGGIPARPTCSVSAEGRATGVTKDTIPGTYSGSNSCSGAFTGGEFTLRRQ